MRKLLSADFILLLRSKIFWAALVFMAVSTAILVVSTYNILVPYGYDPSDWSAEAAMFCMLPGVGIITAIWLHLVVGSDVDQGTLRNKLICGHTRGAIYCAHWLVAIGGALLSLAVSLSIGTALSWYYFRSFMLDGADLLLVLASCALLTVCYAAICVALALNISHKASAVVCGILVMIALAGAASLIDTLLSENMRQGWTPVTLRDHLVILLYDLLPSGQCVQISNLTFDHAACWPLYSLVLTAIVTAIGYLLFRRKDMR